MAQVATIATERARADVVALREQLRAREATVAAVRAEHDKGTGAAREAKAAAQVAEAALAAAEQVW